MLCPLVSAGRLQFPVEGFQVWIVAAVFLILQPEAGHCQTIFHAVCAYD